MKDTRPKNDKRNPTNDRQLREIQQKTLQQAKLKQQQGEKLSVDEFRALLNAQSGEQETQSNSRRYPANENHSDSYQTPQDQTTGIKAKIEQLEKKMEMESLDLAQEKAILDQISKLEEKLTKIAPKN